MKKKTVFHLVTGLGIGGTEMMLLKTVPALQERYDNHVLTLAPSGPIGEELEKRGVPVHYLDLRSGFGIKAVARFGQLVRRHRPKLLITYLIHSDLFGRFAGRLFGISRIACSQRGSLQGWEFLRPIDRLTKGMVTRYLTQTEAARQDLVRTLRISPEKVTVIPNAIIMEEFDFPADRAGVRSELGLPPDAVLAICVANLLPGKGHDYLLEAFARVANTNPRLQLVLVGDGSLRQALQEQAGERVRLLGRRTDVKRLLKASDLFVFPSLAEGMSNAVMEAMAAGLPCLVSSIPPNRELIEEGVSGTFFEPGNVSQLAERLHGLLANRSLQESLGAEARRRIEARFALPAVARQIEQVIEELTCAE